MSYVPTVNQWKGKDWKLISWSQYYFHYTQNADLTKCWQHICVILSTIYFKSTYMKVKMLNRELAIPNQSSGKRLNPETETKLNREMMTGFFPSHVSLGSRRWKECSKTLLEDLTLEFWKTEWKDLWDLLGWESIRSWWGVYRAIGHRPIWWWVTWMF